jgi:hypothetical protein
MQHKPKIAFKRTTFFEKYAENYILRTESQKTNIDTTIIIAANALKALKNERFRSVKSTNTPK